MYYLHSIFDDMHIIYKYKTYYENKVLYYLILVDFAWGGGGGLVMIKKHKKWNIKLNSIWCLTIDLSVKIKKSHQQSGLLFFI